MRRQFAALLVALLAVAGLVPPAGAAPARMSHTSTTAIDVGQPLYLGYDKSLKAYHFVVLGHWRAACAHGTYCWPAIGDGRGHKIGTRDGVRIRFSDSVAFKKFRVESWDVCGVKTYDKSTRVGSSYGAFDNAIAGISDETTVGYKRATYTSPTGSGTTTSGSCKKATEPTSSTGAVGGGGGATVTVWANLKAQHFRYDVWVNPLPSRGRCYSRLYVKGGYTHTWSTSGLAWSAGLGYPWGVSVGVGPVSGSKDYTVWQGTDGDPQADLTSPRLCHH